MSALKIKTESGTWQEVPMLKGDKGDKGDTGFAPVVTVSEITGGHQVAVEDDTQTSTFNVMDGADYVLTAQDKADIYELLLVQYPAVEEVSF